LTPFDRFVMVDWSGGNDRGPTPKKDAIWACVASADGVEAPVYLRNRQVAETWLAERFAAELAAGRRVLAGFDFPFAYPQGFAARLTGDADPLRFWDWLAERIEDAPAANNRFDLAGMINARFPDVGPFWGNGLGRDIADLPRKGLARGMAAVGLPERRQVDLAMKGAFTCWQLSGAGAVGSQVLMGLPVLSRLRGRFAGQIAVWPFETHTTAPLVLAEVFPSLLADAVQAAMNDAPEKIRDAVQVRVLATALAEAQSAGTLAALFDVARSEPLAQSEAWVLGAGAEDTLRQAARAAVKPDLTPPRLRNDCFAMPQGVAWTPVDEALALLRGRLHPVVGTEQAAVPEAAGRVLAAPVTARRSNPPAANSAVDGYGFAHAAIGAGRNVLPLEPGRAAAGAAFDGVLPTGRALRVLTGAILPEGVDTVVLEEDTATDAGHVAFDGPVKPGANTRRAGEDVAEGAQALAAGRRLTPPDLALLAAVGVEAVSVHRRLRVGVLSTGDEIRPVGAPAGPAQTYDANRPMLLALARGWGHEPVDLGHVGDDRDALRAAFDAASGRCDAILTSGGASAGDEDHVSALLGKSGGLQSWRIALKPGRPLALAVWNGVPVFGLPGNPVAAFVCTLIFARPALALLSGAGWCAPTAFSVPAAFEKRKKAGRREYLRARLTPEGHAEVFRSEGSGRISGLSWAEGLVELEDGARHVRPGDPVRYLPFAGLIG
jgi:molybdopterin molybdotransferase